MTENRMRSRSAHHPLRRAHRRGVLVMLGVVCASAIGAICGVEALAEGRHADFKIIVHPKNPVRAASREVIADMFLKRVVAWRNGETVKPVDQHQRSRVREVFSEHVLKRSVAAVRRYWQQRIFSGRDVPPPELESDRAVLRYVLKHEGAIGYVSADFDAEGVHVLALR